MTTVRCKFRLNSIKLSEGSKRVDDADGKSQYVPVEQRTLEMSAVYGNGDPAHENTKFWQASPSGSFVVSCVNADVVAHMKLGGEYYIDITPAESA